MDWFLYDRNLHQEWVKKYKKLKGIFKEVFVEKGLEKVLFIRQSKI